MTLGAVFREVFPMYLSLGMTAEEFWHGPFWLASSYRKKAELDREAKAFDEWRRGYYHYIAIASALTPECPFPDEPVFLPDSPGRRRRRALREAEANQRKMLAFAESFNKSFEEREERSRTED